MKPKNKFQQRVFELSKKLSSITKTQAKWGNQNCIDHIGRRTKKGVVSCLECGHSWTDKTTETHCICPNCNTKLIINDTTQRIFKDYQYLCIVTTCEEFQILRFVYINYRAKVGEKAQYFQSEVIQLWINPKGRHVTIAKLRPMFCFTDTWNFSSNLEVRPNKTFYNAIPTAIYPRQKLIHEIERSGFTGDFYKLTPFTLFQYLLTENRAETLQKAKQIKLLQFFAYNTHQKIDKYWASIRICIRNDYQIEDVSIWCDYIDLLRFFNKDLHNAKYVCPANLKAEHDRYVKKKQDYLEKQRHEEAKIRAVEHEETYKEMKSKFFGIQFSDGLIQIKVLESVDEIMKEGEALHHCVFVNEYHLRADSLLLSACINDERLETIEFSLSKLQVLQSRGVCNKNTDYHDRILKLVKKNVPQIRKRIHNKQHQNLSTAI
jgi:hypothetical protein